MIFGHKILGITPVPFGQMIDGLIRSWNQRATWTLGNEVDHACDTAME